MSSSGGVLGRRAPVRSAPTPTRTRIPTPTPMRKARPVEIAARTVIGPSGASSSASRAAHAERALGRLVDRVRAARRPRDDGRRVDLDRGAADLDLEAHEAGRRRPELVLARVVVLRSVTWAFEPLGLLAE